MDIKHKFGLVIGRFQPFHTAHLDLVRFAFKQVETLIIGLGSSNQARDVKNPWTWQERADMTLACLEPEERKRIRFVPLEDFHYSNTRWVAGVQKAIESATGGSEDVRLIGHDKDSSSFYLKLFPQWGPHIEPSFTSDLDATRIRRLVFTQDKIGTKFLVPEPVYNILMRWMDTPEFRRLHAEQHHIWEEQEKWRGALHPPHFVTTDAVCISSGHVLVIRRKSDYGKGLIALPGGYLDVNQTIRSSCIRELKEETSIGMSEQALAQCIVGSQVFDHPSRDLRGRIITHAFFFRLPDGTLHEVKGADDADEAWWMSLNEVDKNRDKFFSDHWHIIDSFRNKF